LHRRRRTKTIVYIAATVFIVLVGLLATFIVLLRNHSFRQSVLRIALPAVSRAVGTNVHVQDFSLQWSIARPSLSIENLVIDGTSHEPSPLFQADHVEIGLQIVSLLERKWYFNQVIIDRPVLRLNVDRDGRTNLPSRVRAEDGSNIFDLGIRFLLTRRGELYYNDRKIPLEASLRDVLLQAHFNPQSKKYSGTINYQNGQIRFRDWHPLIHSLELEFEATPETFTIAHCNLRTRSSQIKFDATVKDFAHPEAKVTYQASLDTVDLPQMLPRLPLTSGVVRLAGSAQFLDDPNRTTLAALSAEGNVNSSSLGVHTAGTGTELREISADYVLHGGDIDVRNLRAQLLGGTLAGSYSMRDVSAAQESQLHAVLRNVNLSAVHAITQPTTPKQFRLQGVANLTLEANWQKAFDALVARGVADLKGSLSPGDSLGGFHTFPIEGHLQIAYSAPAAEMTVTSGYLRMPNTTVTLSGTISRHQSLQIQGQSYELHELESVATAFGLVRQPLELYGVASFKGTIRGSTAQPQIAGHLTSSSLKIRGSEWRMLGATLDASPSHLTLHSAEVNSISNGGRLTFDVNLGLNRWSYGPDSPFEIHLNAARLNLSQLMSLTNSTIPLTGTLSATASLHGSNGNVLGGGTVNVNQATVFHESVPTLTLIFQGDGDSVRVNLNTVIATGSVQGDVLYFPSRKAFDGQVQATNIGLEQLQTLRMRGIRLAGALHLTAKGRGSLDDPNLQLTAYVLHPQVEQYGLSDLSLSANIANHVAQFVFDSQAPSALRGSGKVELSGNYLAEATLNSAPISLAPLFAVYLPAQAADLSGQTELHASITGPLKNPSAMVGQITLPTFSFAYRDIQLANTEPIHLEYRKGLLTLTKTGIRGTGTDVQVEGSFPVVGTGPVSLNAEGHIDLKVVSIVNPDYTASGEIVFNINGNGRLIKPDFKGQIKIVDASLSASGLPLALQNGSGVLNLVDDRVDIERFQGSLNNGTFTVRGNLTYSPAVRLNLLMAANDIRTTYPAGVRHNLDTNLTLTGPLQSLLLRGQVYVTELSFSQAFNLEETLYRFARMKRVLSGASGKLNLDLAVQSTNELTPSTDQLRLNGAANLRVRGTVNQPALWGTIRLNSGELLFRGARYMLKPSSVDFVDPFGIEPRLNIAVETRVKEYNIRLLLLGSLDEMRTTFSSEPPLPPSDTINLLIFGQTNQPITTESTGNLGAVSLLASGVTGTITNRLQKIAGISQLSIDPVLDNNQEGSAVGVTVQQRVTADLLVTFTSDPSSTKRQVLEVEYHATPRISITGVFNQNGGFATDVRIRKTW
jgi:translocation and assembly module TamB